MLECICYLEFTICIRYILYLFYTSYNLFFQRAYFVSGMYHLYSSHNVSHHTYNNIFHCSMLSDHLYISVYIVSATGSTTALVIFTAMCPSDSAEQQTKTTVADFCGFWPILYLRLLALIVFKSGCLIGFPVLIEHDSLRTLQNLNR